MIVFLLAIIAFPIVLFLICLVIRIIRDSPNPIWMLFCMSSVFLVSLGTVALIV